MLLLLHRLELGLSDVDGLLAVVFGLLGHRDFDAGPHLDNHVDNLRPLGELGVFKGTEALEVRLVNHLEQRLGCEAVRVVLENLDCLAADRLVDGDLAFVLGVVEGDAQTEGELHVANDVVVERQD